MAGGGEPERYFIRGEFKHDSEYMPSKFYGLPPPMTLWEESRSLEQMDQWYQSAYENRRAPRAAVAIKGGVSDSVRSFNKKQFEKLQNDPNHIPTLMDDSDSQGAPISFIRLLESPAEMQNMQMREWFLDRISAKYGVTASFQKASGGSSGLSQSMEIEVSNRSADRLRRILNESFVKPVISQLGIEGWETEIAPVQEESEAAEADLRNKHLQMAQLATQLGLEAEWTPENRIDIKAGDVESPQDAEGEEGLGGLLGGGGMEGMAGDEGPGGGDGTGPTPGSGQQPGVPPQEQPEEPDPDRAMMPDRPDDITNRGDDPDEVDTVDLGDQ